MRHLVLALLLALPLLALGCADVDGPVSGDVAEAVQTSDSGHGKAGHDCSACSRGKDGGTAWCDGCGKGYVKGEPTDDKAAVEAAMAAETGAAEAAPKGDGHACACTSPEGPGTMWCDKCDKGFIDGVETADKGAVEAALAAN